VKKKPNDDAGSGGQLNKLNWCGQSVAASKDFSAMMRWVDDAQADFGAAHWFMRKVLRLRCTGGGEMPFSNVPRVPTCVIERSYASYSHTYTYINTHTKCRPLFNSTSSFFSTKLVNFVFHGFGDSTGGSFALDRHAHKDNVADCKELLVAKDFRA